MSVLPTAALAISNAFSRFERGATTFRDGVSGESDADPARGAAEMIEAKAQLKAGVATVRIADEMLKTLLDIGAHR